MSEILWTASDLSQALQKPVSLLQPVTGVSIDSRKITPGNLFIALSGENFDGNDFIADAAAKGAVAAIVSKMPANNPANCAIIQVADTYHALLALGKYARKRFTGKIIGITGSVGKTGTKESLAFVLSQQGKTFATVGNLNNHIGVPLSLARMPKDARYAVIEMGMNHPGEIAPLSQLCEPFVGIVTAVAPAHIEFFQDGIAGIADEKAQIVAGMNADSIAIFNRDTPHFDRMTKIAQDRKIGRIIGFGADPLAQARLLDCQTLPNQTKVRADILGTVLEYTMGIPGRHIAINSLAILTAVQAVQADLQKAAQDLAHIKPVAGRGLRRTIPVAGGSIELIDESYNASPDSMRAALAVLSESPIMPSGRRIAVLGDMLELGSHAPDLHLSLIPAIQNAHLDKLFLCGPHMQAVANALQGKVSCHYAADSAILAKDVAPAIQAGDIIMVKGSLGSKMRLIIEALDRQSLKK